MDFESFKNETIEMLISFYNKYQKVPGIFGGLSEVGKSYYNPMPLLSPDDKVVYVERIIPHFLSLVPSTAICIIQEAWMVIVDNRDKDLRKMYDEGIITPSTSSERKDVALLTFETLAGHELYIYEKTESGLNQIEHRHGEVTGQLTHLLSPVKPSLN